MAEPQPNIELPPDHARRDASVPGTLPVMEYAPLAHPQCPMYRRVVCWAMQLGGLLCLGWVVRGMLFGISLSAGQMVIGVMIGIGLMSGGLIIRVMYLPWHQFKRSKE